MPNPNNRSLVGYFDPKGGEIINTTGIDDGTTSDSTTWSSKKIAEEIAKIAGDNNIYDGGSANDDDYDINYDGGGATP